MCRAPFAPGIADLRAEGQGLPFFEETGKHEGSPASQLIRPRAERLKNFGP